MRAIAQRLLNSPSQAQQHDAEKRYPNGVGAMIFLTLRERHVMFAQRPGKCSKKTI
jgi:hypothetical protein